MFYNNNLKGYGKGYVGRKNVAERPPWCAVGSADKDRRAMASAWPTRITNLGIENQQLVILFGSHTQCAGFQGICNCHIEGGKNVGNC